MPERDSLSSILTKIRACVVSRAVRVSTWAGLACLLALCGCSAVRVRLGTRVSLVKIPAASVSSIAVSLPQGSAVAPGEKSPLVVTLTGPNGAVWVTEGAGKGKILWKDLAVTASVVRVDKKGVLSLPHDPRISEGKTGHITITAPSHPDLHADLDIPLRYDYNFVSSFSGSKGSDGFNGTDGVNGISGSMGSIDPNYPSAGGNGTDGSDGSNGQDGSNGGDGPTVEMRMTLRPGSHPLLQIGVLATGHKERFYLVDPQGGSLMVTSAGGAGGSGARAAAEAEVVPAVRGHRMEAMEEAVPMGATAWMDHRGEREASA